MVDLDPQIPDRAFKFGMAEEELNRTEILGPSVDQRRFRTSQRMRAVARRVQSNRGNPRSNDSRVLPGREMRRLRNATRKEELLRFEMSALNPGRDRISCLLGDLELHRSLSLRLHDNRARRDLTALHNIVDTKRNQVTSAQFADSR